MKEHFLPKPALQNSVNFCTFRRRKTAIGQHSHGVFDLCDGLLAPISTEVTLLSLRSTQSERHLRQFWPRRSQFIQPANFSSLSAVICSGLVKRLPLAARESSGMPFR